MVVYSSENPRVMEMGLGAVFLVDSPDNWGEASLMWALKKLSRALPRDYRTRSLVPIDRNI